VHRLLKGVGELNPPPPPSLGESHFCNAGFFDIFLLTQVLQFWHQRSNQQNFGFLSMLGKIINSV